ncbi:hypothetical protein [Mycobacterium sp. UM_Kg1]
MGPGVPAGMTTPAGAAAAGGRGGLRSGGTPRYGVKPTVIPKQVFAQ